jgi:hypothetical protein
MLIVLGCFDEGAKERLLAKYIDTPSGSVKEDVLRFGKRRCFGQDLSQILGI